MAPVTTRGIGTQPDADVDHAADDEQRRWLRATARCTGRIPNDSLAFALWAGARQQRSEDRSETRGRQDDTAHGPTAGRLGIARSVANVPRQQVGGLGRRRRIPRPARNGTRSSFRSAPNAASRAPTKPIPYPELDSWSTAADGPMTRERGLGEGGGAPPESGGGICHAGPRGSTRRGCPGRRTCRS